MTGSSRWYSLPLISCLLVAMVSASQAAYPDHPIHFVVSSTAGGSTDALARLVGQKLSEKWNQPVVVEDRAGASGLVAAEFVAHAPADGYTILVDSTTHTINAANAVNGTTKLNFDPLNGFAAITRIGSQPEVLVANPTALPATSLKELIALAKSKPGKLSFGDNGTGSSTYLGMALLLNRTGTDMLHVTYKGTNDAMVAVLGGEVQLMVGSVAAVGPQINSGKLRGLGIMSEHRSKTLPDVPTIIEGLNLPDFAVEAWYGLFAPAGTPKDIVAKLNNDIVAIIKSPEVQQRMEHEGLNPVGDSPEESDKYVHNETAMWAGLLRQVDVKN